MMNKSKKDTTLEYIKAGLGLPPLNVGKSTQKYTPLEYIKAGYGLAPLPDLNFKKEINISALIDRATPKKVIYINSRRAWCPRCRSEAYYRVDFWRKNYCPDCGQALDWEE